MECKSCGSKMRYVDWFYPGFWYCDNCCNKQEDENDSS